MSTELNEIQLDALRELANIASGGAASALASMLGREVEISVPRALTLPVADAPASAGPLDRRVAGVAIPLEGDIPGIVVLVFSEPDASSLCNMLGVDYGSAVGDSALCEIGNILGTSYINALATITGLEMMPEPPQMAAALLGDIFPLLMAEAAAGSADALIMDSELDVQGDSCSLSFFLIPTAGGAESLLRPLGLAA
jgi:chemotaxis protein CheC